MVAVVEVLAIVVGNAANSGRSIFNDRSDCIDSCANSGSSLNNAIKVMMVVTMKRRLC